MKLKEYKKTDEWKTIDCAIYLDVDGEEINPATEIKRSRMNNMEIVSVEKSTERCITTAIIVLKKAVKR